MVIIAKAIEVPPVVAQQPKAIVRALELIQVDVEHEYRVAQRIALR